MGAQRKMRPFGAILDHFIIFFHLLKSKNFWRLYDIDKDHKWQTFNNPVIYPFVGSSS